MTALLPQPRRMALADQDVEVVATRRLDDPGLPAQGYRIVIGADGRVDVAAADEAGAFYAEQTLAQLLAAHGGRLPVGAIEDWPDLAVRGVMLDVSRDKVPTMATLRGLIDRFASWKLNHVELYLEHTFAYEGREEVWGSASPFTADEVRELDAFCRDRHIELVPNQNCLGHMERWLRHERYAPLALSPDGFTFLGAHRGPSTLDPSNPASLAFVRSLLGELLPNFTSRQVNVGLDEPWELPHDRFDDYLAWVRAVRAAPELDGRELLMWGDILAGKPGGGPVELPDGITVCDWGYEADAPFAERAARFAAAGRRFLLCPGTSSWLTILGRWSNARTNIDAAVLAAIEHGGDGIVVTDWGDQGHLQYLPVSELPLAFAAAASWCHEANGGTSLGGVSLGGTSLGNVSLGGTSLRELVDAQVYGNPDAGVAAVLADLGDAHRALAAQLPNMSLLVAGLYAPALQLGRGPAKGLTVEQYEEAAGTLAACRDRLPAIRCRRDDAALVVGELANAIDLVEVCIDDALARLAGDGSLASIPASTRTELAGRLDGIVGRHRALWLARNRPGGLADSVGRLTRLQDAYAAGTADGLPLYG